VKFPTRSNREIFMWNREFTGSKQGGLPTYYLIIWTGCRAFEACQSYFAQKKR
jgi:hypothetical protein